MPDTDTAVNLYVQGSCSEMGGRIEGSPEACGASHLAYTSAKQQGSCFKKTENKEWASWDFDQLDPSKLEPAGKRKPQSKKKCSHQISL